MHDSIATLDARTGHRITNPSVRDMIDSYVGAGLHKRLPATDSRILPARRSLDWDSLTATASAGAVLSATRERRRATVAHARVVEDSEGWPADDVTVVSVGPCAAAAGSKREKRYALWSVGATIASLRSRGLRLGDLRRDVAAGRVVLSVAVADVGVAETEGDE